MLHAVKAKLIFPTIAPPLLLKLLLFLLPLKVSIYMGIFSQILPPTCSLVLLCPCCPLFESTLLDLELEVQLCE